MVDEIKIAEKAIEIGLISKSQLDECLKIKKDIHSLGMEIKSLQDIFISKNYISMEDWQGISENLQDFSSSGFDTSHKTVQIESKESKDSFSREVLGNKELPNIDGYSIVEEIGKGAMGSVYRGLQISMERPVAIKVLDKKLSKDKNLVERFTLEARTTARLSHENIISGIDAGITKDGVRYFVMEYVEGNSLGEILEHNVKLDPVDAATILMKVADALEYAHQEGIIHRDIKPDNIIMTDENIPKLCDLGLVRDFADDSRLTLEGHALGTPHYISPEQARGQRDNIDNRSDIYSLGATFYHMVTGSPPFPQKNPAVVCAMHATKPFPNPLSLEPNIPKTICKIIDKCTQKKPTKRYQDCGQIVDDLRTFLQTHSPFQDGEEEHESENEEPDFVEEDTPLTFADEKQRPTRRKVRRVRTTPVRAQAPATEYSTSSLVVAVLSVLIILGGAGYYGYQVFQKQKDNTIIENQTNVNTTDYEKQVLEKIALRINLGLLDLNNPDKVREEKSKYLNILDEYKQKKIDDKEIEKYFSVIEKTIKKEEIQFEDFLEKRANEKYENIQSIINSLSVGGSKNILREKNKQQDQLKTLKNIYSELLRFEKGLYFTKKGEEILSEITTIKNVLTENAKEQYSLNVEPASEKKNYKKAIKECDSILEFAIEDEVLYLEGKKEYFAREYRDYQEKAYAAVREQFRNGIDKALIAENYEEAKKHCLSYSEKPFLSEIVQQEMNKLTAYITIVEQLGKSKSLKSKLSSGDVDSLLIDEMKLPSNDATKWAFAVVFMNNNLLKKAQSIFGSSEENRIFLDYIKTKSDNANAKELFTEIKKIAKKDSRKAFRNILELKKYTGTSYYEENADEIKNYVNGVSRLYLKEYAVDLYFKNPFVRLNHETWDFEIEYSLNSPEHLQDFFGTMDSAICGIDDLQLTSFASQLQDVFEVYWKGKVKGKLELEVAATPNEQDFHNIGVSFYKKNEELASLDKHLFLINYAALEFVMHEMYNKESDAALYLSEINKIPKAEKSQTMLGYVDGSAKYLRYTTKYKDIPLDQKYFNAINFQGVKIRIKADNKINAWVDNREFSFDNVKSSYGYVGLYASSRAKFSSLKIKGTLEGNWIKQIIQEVTSQEQIYIKIAEKRESTP